MFSEFQGASYPERYNILCQRLMQEQLYSAASIIASARTASADGAYVELNGMTGLRTFVTELAGHIAAEAARS
ncbi:Type II restriction enzyme like protein [Thioalkalivibrio nitratireducens DSM 14787]|uniref:Type II restriction enzyme like protein n=1 Tax=Thioalkalivibrio nitratireducens (strain DSM 14787 / UNIQEM 213 / ALEN2) TaxID=1255043 RepID=L0DSM3_THIND|nr:Type II restriction enzyme like protein [Thioalkalivibrio nitratireducens DSM 14787]